LPDAALALTGRTGIAAVSGELRRFAGLAAPMVLSRFGVAALALADGVMLARYSAEQLAVLGLADSVMGRVLEVSMVAATAGLALAAQARAAGPAQAGRIGNVWHNGLALAFGLGLAALLVGSLGGPLLHALGQPAALAAQAAQVMAILGLSAMPALVGLVCAGLLESIGRARTVVAVVVLANLANIGLNQWLIFGGPGVQALGATGAAIATLLVRLVMAAGLFTLLWRCARRPPGDGYGLRAGFDRAAWQAGAEQRRRGAAAAATVGMLALMSLGLPVMAGWLGPDALAQATALFLCLVPAMVLAWGLADAAALRVAAIAGADRRAGDGIRSSGWRMMLLPAGLWALFVAAGLTQGSAWLQLMLGQPALVAAVLPLLGLGLLVVAGDTASIMFGAMLRSLGVLRGPLMAQALSSLALLPLAAALAFGLGWQLQGLLAAQAAMALARAVALAFMFDQTARRQDRRTHVDGVLGTTAPHPVPTTGQPAPSR
jgi:MATE family multidrug resistance protein